MSVMLILISVYVIGYEDPLLQHSIHILFSKMVSFNKLKIAFCVLKKPILSMLFAIMSICSYKKEGQRFYFMINKTKQL